MKDTVVAGSLRATDTLFSTTAQFQILRAPTSSNGTTFGPGSTNNLLKSNGTSVYWTTLVASDIPTLSITDKTSGTLPVTRGGTGVTAIANIQAGKDGDGNTISSTYLKLSGGTLTGNLTISHATSATMTADSTNPKITFSESGAQPVHLIYSDWDSYRSPAGLKIVGGTSATPAWLEVEGQVYAAGFNGPLTGNAATATNADKVDNYHAADLWRKDGGTWNGSANIACTPTAAGQEYSFDLGNAYTGTYWQVWSGKNSATILACFNDDRRVSVPVRLDTAWLRVVNNSSNNSDDAMVYLENKTDSDWALKINCDGHNYGVRIDTADNASNALQTQGRIICKTLFANQGTNGERQVGVDSETSGNLYMWANTTDKGLYSGSGYMTGPVIKITSDSKTFYGNCTGSAGSVAWGNVTGKPNRAGSDSDGGPAQTVKGAYTSNGGKQNPNYFGMNKVGFLMMDTTVNNNTQYKDWIIMDCYSGGDVGGGVAFGVNRQSLGAYIMRSAATRTSWAESAELLGTHNYTSYCPTKTGSGASGTWGISISGNAATATKATQDGSGNIITSTYAKLNSANNLIHAGNEFTFAASGQSGSVWFNYRTAGGTNGDITEYVFGDGKTGRLASITSGTFNGNATSANYLSTYASNGSDSLSCLQNGFSGIPKSVGTAVRLQHGSHDMAFGWFLDGYGYSNAYGGWFISEYSTPKWVGVSNGSWTTSYFLTSSNYTSYCPTKGGSGASGTWSINVTGSAGSVAWGNVTGKPGLFTQRSLNDTNIDSTSGNWTTSVSEFGTAHGTFPYQSSTWMQIIQFDAVHFRAQLGITVDSSGNGTRNLWFRSRWANSSWSMWHSVSSSHGDVEFGF